MQQPADPREKTLVETVRASLIMLCFGLGVLAFLVAIDRPEWFHIRPVSGTAAAMSNASSLAAGKADARVERHHTS